MKTHLKLAPLCALLLLPTFLGNTCTTQSTADRLDSAIIAATETFDAAIAWADRNPEYVAAHANIAEAVAKIRAELDGVPQPTETLTRLHLLRDAFQQSRATPQEVETAIAQARIYLETVRSLMRPTP